MHSFLHIGAGKLGLGLIAPLTARLEVAASFVIDERRSSAKNDALLSGCEIRLRAGRRILQTIPSIDVRSWDGNRLRPDLDHPPSIVSCAVGPAGAEYAVSVVRHLVDRFADRYRDTPLLFIPFENEPVYVIEPLFRIQPERVVVIDAIVDRICKSAGISKTQHTIDVQTEEYSNIVLRVPSIDQRHRATVESILEATGLGRYVADSDEEYRFARHKKAWAVNGLHYVLALRAISELNRYDIKLTKYYGQKGIDQDFLIAIVQDYTSAIVLCGLRMGVAVSAPDIKKDVELSVARLLHAEESTGRLVKGLAEVAKAAASMVRPAPDAEDDVTYAPETPGLAKRYADFLLKWDTRVSAAVRELMDGLPQLPRITHTPRLPLASDMLLLQTNRLFTELIHAREIGLL